MKVCIRLSRDGRDDRLIVLRAGNGAILYEEDFAGLDDFGRARAVGRAIENMAECGGALEIGDRLKLELSNEHFSFR